MSKRTKILGVLIILLVGGGLFFVYLAGQQECVSEKLIGPLDKPTNTFFVTIPKGEYHELDIRLNDIKSYSERKSIEGHLTIDGKTTVFNLASATQRNGRRMGGEQVDWGFIIAASWHNSLLASGKRCSIEVTIPNDFPKDASLRLEYIFRYRDTWFR